MNRNITIVNSFKASILFFLLFLSVNTYALDTPSKSINGFFSKSIQQLEEYFITELLLIDSSFGYSEKNEDISKFSDQQALATITITEDWASGTYSGGSPTGTGGWTSNWTEGNDDGSASGGSILITSGELELIGSSGSPIRTIERIVDVTGASSATLSFDWRLPSDGFENNDFLRVHYSTDGGSNFTQLYSQDLETLEAIDSGTEMLPITGLSVNSIIIQFEYIASFNTEISFIDNVVISYDDGGGSGPSGNLTCSAAANEITGTAFEDYNYDGLYDTNEFLGVKGVPVTATDSLNNSFSAVTDATGGYTISGLITNRTYRIEFTFPDSVAWAKPTFYGGDNGTTVQFLQPGNCANLGLASPKDYCQSDPEVVITCYENGDGSANNNLATLMWTYSDSEIPVKFGGSAPNPTALTTIAQVGTVWGMDYDSEGEQIYMSAFTRRHISLGPLGTGGIYIANTTGYVGSFDLQGVTPANGGAALDFGTITRSTVAGAVTNGAGGDNQLSQDPTEATVDLDAFDKVGKSAMGDLEISEDGNSLWTVNLNDGEAALIRVNLRNGSNPIPTDGSNPASAIVDRYLISGMNPPSCTNGVFRPWGLTFHRGVGYLGGVCSAESGGTAADLKAYVLSFDPTNPTSLTEVLSFDLDFNREPKSRFVFAGGHTEDADWRPWVDQWSDLTFNNNRYVDNAVPILSDIEFADNGDMVLGFADRNSFQLGYQQYAATSGASSGSNLYDVELGGDMYHACFDGSAWVIEGNVSCPDDDRDIPTFLGDVTNDGPSGTGEYYWADYWAPSSNGHAEITNGALKILRGQDEVVSNALDPLFNFQINTWANTHGIVKMSTSDGSRNDDYLVINNNGTDLGKSGGLSEPALLCDPAPIEIGNYVWLDANSDGIQDAGETALEGIRIELYDNAGNLLAFDSTNSLGQYYFSGNGIDDAAWQTVDDTLATNTSYYIVAAAGGQYGANGLNVDGTDYTLTTANANSNNSDAIDSDGAIASGVDADFDGAPYVQITTGSAGEVNHTYDFGFSTPCTAMIQQVYTENCSGTTSFTADLKVIVSWTGAPSGEDILVTYAGGNTQTVPVATTGTSPDTVTILGITADGSKNNEIIATFATTITCADTFAFTAPNPCPPNVMACTGSSGVGGNVFEDYNYDGIDAGTTELGVQGIKVYAYDCNGNKIDSAYTDSDGDYLLNTTGNGGGLSSGEQYRIEFDLPESIACWAEPTLAGFNNGTTVQFVREPACASLGIANSADYCQDNPFLVVPCYIGGPNTGTSDAVVRWSYGNTGFGPDDKIKIAEEGQVAALWGMAYNRTDKKAYGSTVLHRHIGLHEGAGGGGLDAIFEIDPLSGTPNGTVWLELTDDLGIDVGQSLVQNNAGRGITATLNHDVAAYSLVGTVGIGDIEINEDDNTLYVMNLFNKKLYEIDVATKTLQDSFLVPDPGCTNGTYRPWAIEYHKGEVYVGAICDASTAGKDATAGDALTNTTGRSDLHAYVYRLDGSSFTEVLDFVLDYDRQPPHGGGFQDFGLIDGWFPWTNDMPLAAATLGNGNRVLGYPQPILSDIVFDVEGSMVLSFMDRFGLQVGNNNYGINPPSTDLFQSITAGDILRACPNGDVWAIEGTANSCTNTGGHAINSGTGYYSNGVGEYYEGDLFDKDDPATNPVPPFDHPEITMGSAILLAGQGEVLSTTYDPNSGGTYFGTGGVITLDNQSGLYKRGFQIYENDTEDILFAKGVGLGDLIAICDSAPLEIGNYVWLDSDEDGIQDACELPLENIIVKLYNAVGEVVAIDTTNNKGEYYFNDTKIAAYTTQSDTTLLANTDYTVVIMGSTTTSFADSKLTVNGTEYDLTTQNATELGHSNSDLIDSDGSLTGNPVTAAIGMPFTTVTTGNAGQVNHSLDFGFKPSTNYDYGDLPDIADGTTGVNDYETYDSTGGPSHQIIAGLFLGDTVDVDTDGLPDALAVGDDNDGADDEDGVIILTSLNVSPGGMIRLPLIVTNMTTDTAYLEAWIDWNGDGDFDIVNELVADLKDNEDGVFPAYLDISVPTDALTGSSVGFRVRLSNTNNMTPYGRVNSGEVEDYLLSIDCPQVICLPFETELKRE